MESEDPGYRTITNPFLLEKERSLYTPKKTTIVKNIMSFMFTEKIYSKWMKENQMKKYQDMKDLLPKINGLILDVGIGPGWFEEFFGISSIGIDSDKNSKADVIASGDLIPFKDKSFDFVVCLDTIHLLTGVDIIRVLKNNGFLLVSHFVNKDNEIKVEEKLLNMFSNLKLLKRKVVGDKEKDLVMLFGPMV